MYSEVQSAIGDTLQAIRDLDPSLLDWEDEELDFRQVPCKFDYSGVHLHDAGTSR